MPSYTRTTWVNGSTPVDAANMNNIEAFLASLSDPSVTFNGGGMLTLLKLVLTIGTLTRIEKYSGAADQVITHGLGVTPDLTIPYYAGSFGTAPSQAIAVKNVGSTTFEVVGQSGYSWFVVAICF
ncbi:MAG: hypothetical protein ACRDHZ_00780 [Ktedonobacteraceae bacterium]